MRVIGGRYKSGLGERGGGGGKGVFFCEVLKRW